MVLAVDIGNSSICLGIFQNGRLAMTAKLSADRAKTPDEYAVLIAGVFSMHGISTESVEDAVLSSVVPQLTHTVLSALRQFHIVPLVVGSGVRTGLNIRVENPSMLGADIVADTVAALQIKNPPLMIIDLGSATTLTAVNRKGELIGCIIAAGVKASLDALSEKCAMLPDMSLSQPKQLFGKNTLDAVNAGTVYGTALMLDGFIEKFREESVDEASESEDESVSVVATGGLAGLILPCMRNKVIYEPNLTVIGLYRIWELRKR